jgi:hypothetical protein
MSLSSNWLRKAGSQPENVGSNPSRDILILTT